jgi:uncharacterized protein YciI
MKHFIIEIKYLVPFSEIEKVLLEHRNFLQKGYDAGLLLFSGPQEPKIGGLIVARGESLEKIKDYFKDDPFLKHHIADYRYIEFNPVKFQPLLKDWI